MRMKVSTFRGVWCGLVATVTTGDLMFPAVRQIVGVPIPVSKAPPVAVDEMEVDELTASEMEVDSDRPSLSLQKLPEALRERVVASGFGVDDLGPGDGSSIRLPGSSTLLVDRLDLLGLLAPEERAWATVRNRYDQFESARRRAARGQLSLAELQAMNGGWLLPEELDAFPMAGTIGISRGPGGTLVGDPLFLQLCNSTSEILRRPRQGYPRVQPPAQVRLQFRPEALVRVKPWGAYGSKSVEEMRDWLESIFDRFTAELGLDTTTVEGARERFMKWSAYLQQYAEEEVTGTVVKILPRIVPEDRQLPSSGRPMSYLVRFPKLPAPRIFQTEVSPQDIDPANAVEVEEEGDIPEEEEGDIPVRPGGWRFYRTGAKLALTQGNRAGSSVSETEARISADQGRFMELEVPFYRLYADVTAAKDRNMNPLIVAVNQQELGEEAEEELRATPPITTGTADDARDLAAVLNSLRPPA